jgi:cell division septum initiation protein DivIVA
MDDINTYLESLQQKLQQLLHNHKQLQQENDRLQKELNKANGSLSEKSDELEKLQQQADILKLGVKNRGAADKQLLEKRIDMYLKEIDKCLALLNG